jgi:hypothetical protein
MASDTPTGMEYRRASERAASSGELAVVDR